MANEIWFSIEKSPEGYPQTRDWEGLHSEIVDEAASSFRIKSIPFYLRNIAYNDIIKAKRNQNGYLEFDKIIERSGWSIYRLLLQDRSLSSDTKQKLLSLDADVEEDDGLIAIAVPPNANFGKIVEFILDGKEQGKWGAQDGFIFD